MALDFDGNDDHLDMGDPAALDITGAYTLACWVKCSSLTTAFGLISKVLGAPNFTYELITAGTAPFGNIVVNTSGDGSTVVTRRSSGAIDDAAWHHIATVFAPSTNLDTYIDGALSNGSLTGTIPASTYTNAGSLCIATRSYNKTTYPGSHFPGAIADARVYNRALSAGEIAMLYHLRGGDNIDGLVGRWPMNEKIDGAIMSGGDVTIDVTPTGAHGALNGAPIYRQAPLRYFGAVEAVMTD